MVASDDNSQLPLRVVTEAGDKDSKIGVVLCPSDQREGGKYKLMRRPRNE